jgi:hypothetical protein
MQFLPACNFAFSFQVFILPFHNSLREKDETGSIAHKSYTQAIGLSCAYYFIAWFLLAGFSYHVIAHDGIPAGDEPIWFKGCIPLFITVIANFTREVPLIVITTVMILVALLL